MNLLKKIGMLLYVIGIFLFLVNLYFSKNIVKPDIFYFFLLFLGSILQFFPQLKIVKQEDVSLQGRKYFMGIVLSIIFFFVILILTIKYFYF